MDESTRREEEDDNEGRRRNASDSDRDKLRDKNTWRKTSDDDAALTKREQEQRWPIG